MLTDIGRRIMAKTNKSTGLTDRELLDKIKTSHEQSKIIRRYGAPPRSRIQFDPKMFQPDPNRLRTKKGKRRTQIQRLRSQKVLPRR